MITNLMFFKIVSTIIINNIASTKCQVSYILGESRKVNHLHNFIHSILMDIQNDGFTIACYNL